MTRHRLLAAAALCLLLAGCDRAADRPPQTALAHDASPATGHQKMLTLLDEIARWTPEEHPYLGNGHRRRLQQGLALLELNDAAGPGEKWSLLVEAGNIELRMNDIPAAIQYFTQAYQLLPQVDPAEVARFANQTRFHLGVAYLRLGETQNCCLRHTAESCIVPIRGGGIHTRQNGSRQAIRYFKEVLEHSFLDRPVPIRSRDQLMDVLTVEESARWLLNIAYMTLGEYPGGVPEKFLIPPSVFRSKIDFPRFENVAPRLHLNTFNLSGGVILDDFDGDDYLDIVTSTWDTTGQTRFFRNNTDGTFSERTEQAGLLGFYGGLNMVQADYDNDGDVDVFIVRGAWLFEKGQHPNSLLQNDGKGHFTDVTFEAGLGEVHYPTKTAAWADYDNDGDLDLYIGNESLPQLAGASEWYRYDGVGSAGFHFPSQLFRNNGNGTFTDVAAAAGVDDLLFAMGAVWGDYNADRYPDLFVSNIPDNRLYRNNRDGTFTNVAAELNVTRPNGSFPAWFWDYNNDGALDLYVGCSTGPVGLLALNPDGLGVPAENRAVRYLQSCFQSELNCLYEGDGHGGFRDVARQRRLNYPAQPMGANYGDLNNDGYPDFYLATGDRAYSELRPNVMFLNQFPDGFADVTMSGGFGHLQKGHGVSFADLDNDGDQDVYAQTGGAYAGDKYSDALFENPGFGNHWLTIKLEGRQSNRSAIGARIHLEVMENGKPRSIYKHVDSGGSFGANPLRQTIGVGAASQVRLLEIFWPTTGSTQTFRDVPADQIIEIAEGDAEYVPLKLRKYRLGGAAVKGSESGIAVIP